MILPNQPQQFNKQQREKRINPMIKMMNRISSTAMLAVAFMLCATSAWAATPVAVWDGDFTASRTGFSLQRNGNAISQDNSTITIDQSVGVKVDFTTGIGAMTVMFKYSDLTLGTQKTLATSFVSGADENRTGVYLDSDGTAKGIANTGNWNNPVGSLSKSSGVLAFTYSGTGGTALYYISSLGVRTQVYYKDNLRWSSDTSINGCTIGGERAKGTTSLLGAATGMKITGIAIFNGTLTESDMTSYVWPSSYTQASATVSEDTSLSSILSAAGITTETRNTTALTITATDNPTITIDDIVTLGCLTINGAATIKVSPSLYDEGCFKKSVVYAHGWISAAGATLVAKYGSWKGVFQNTRKELVLCAQDAETISINIGGGSSGTESPAANLVTGSDYYGLYPTPGDAWNNISGRWSGGSRTVTLTSAKAFDGETTTTRATVQLSGTANNTYQWTGTSVPYLRGYLDDTGGVQVEIVGVPYSEYDVIIYATSDSSLKLNYFTINEVNYTCGNDGVAAEGTDSWGTGQTTTPTFGKNAMLVRGVTGSTLTVSGTRAANSGPRVTVCAVQIINKGVVEASDWSANLNSTTSFTGGNGAGLSDQSGTWVNGSLASLTITNQANNATLTLDGTITAGTLKIVGAEGKNLTLAKDPGATLDITVYDLTEAEEETTFLFDPDFSKVNSGSNLIGVGFDYTGAIASGRHYIGSANVLTLSEVGSGVVNIGGSGTITGGLGISGDATVTFSGNYTSSGDTMLGATKGVLNIAEGAAIEVPHVRLVNSSSSVACTMNVDGELTVSSVSTSSNVYDDRLSYKGILFGHWSGSSTVNVGGTGSITGNSAWMQLTYTAPNTMTVNGGTVKVRGINGGTYSSGNSSLTLTGGGTIEIAEGFVNMGHITRDYGYGTIKTYSYGNSTGWSDPGDITFSDSASGTTIDPCGMDNVFSGALSGSGKIIVNDSVGGGSVSFTGSSNNLTGNIFVSGTGNGVVLTLTPAEVTSSSNITVGSGGTLKIKVTAADIIEGFDASAKVSNSGGTVMFVDSTGTQITENVSVDGETLNPVIRTWGASTNGEWDSAANWVSGVAPSSGERTVLATADATITVSTSSGAGAVSVEESTTIAGTAAALQSFAANVTSITIASGKTLTLSCTDDGTYEFSRAIGGAGALAVSCGTVTLSGANTFSGNMIVCANTKAIAGVEGTSGDGGNGPFGPKVTAASVASTLRRVVVQSGGTIDMNGKAEMRYFFMLAGDGIDGNGALVNTGSEIGASKANVGGIELAGDASIGGSGTFGIIAGGYNTTVFDLSGYTLSKKGNNTVYVINGTKKANSTSGVLKVESGTVYIYDGGSSYNRTTDLGDTSVQVASGTLTVDGAFNIGDINQTGGTVDLGASKTWTVGGVLTQNAGTLNVAGTLRLTKSQNSVFVGANIASGATCNVTGTWNSETSPYHRLSLNGIMTVTGSYTSQGDIRIGSTGQFVVTGTGGVAAVYNISNSGAVSIESIGNLKDYGGQSQYPTKVTNTATGKVVFVPTDSSVGSGIGDFGTHVDTTSGSVEVDVSSLTLPTGTSKKTLFVTSTALDLSKFSVKGNADYYLQQNAQEAETDPGALTLQLHAAKDSAGVYYDDIEGAFDAIVADHTLTITILDGTEANYATELAENGLFVSGTQVRFLAAKVKDVMGNDLQSFANVAEAIAYAGETPYTRYVVVYATTTVETSVSPFLLECADGVSITLNHASNEYQYSSTLATESIYQYSATPKAADYTWNGETDNWGTPSNWLFAGNEAARYPRISGDTATFNDDASLELGTAISIGQLNVGSATVSFTAAGSAIESGESVNFTTANGIVLTDVDATLRVRSVNLTPAPTTSLAGKYVVSATAGGWTTYTVADSAATVYDAEDNEVGSYGTVADAVTAAADGQKVRLFANSSDAVTLNGKSITLIEGDYTFSGSFTGNGTLVLPAGTLLKSPSPDRWVSGWTGTVWVKGIDNICGTSTAGSTLFEPNKYGCEGSVLKLSGIKGWINATKSSAGGFTINPTIEVDNDTYEYGLWLSNGNGYNQNNDYRNHTILKGLKGSGILKGSDSGGNALLLVNKWDGFTGTLTLENKIVVFGDSLPEEQAHVEGGGFVVVGSEESVSVPDGKRWTLGNGVVVYENGNLSLGTGASIVNTTESNTWIKRGTGTVTLNAPGDLPATPANDWTGTVVLPSLTASSGWSLNQYGNSGSTVEILGITGGWISEAGKAVAPKLKLTGDIVIGAMSSWTYSFSEITGGGNLSFATTGSQPSSVTISKVAEGYTGAISSTLTTPVTIGELKLSSLPACDQKILSVGGTGSISLDISKIKVGESPLPAKYKVERRPEGAEGDGLYIYYYGTIFSVY